MAEIGSHEGGYTEFVLGVTGKLNAGRNHIAVQVDTRAIITKWPPQKTGHRLPASDA